MDNYPVGVLYREKEGPGRGWWGPPKGTHGSDSQELSGWKSENWPSRHVFVRPSEEVKKQVHNSMTVHTKQGSGAYDSDVVKGATVYPVNYHSTLDEAVEEMPASMRSMIKGIDSYGGGTGRQFTTEYHRRVGGSSVGVNGFVDSKEGRLFFTNSGEVNPHLVRSLIGQMLWDHGSKPPSFAEFAKTNPKLSYISKKKGARVAFGDAYAYVQSGRSGDRKASEYGVLAEPVIEVLEEVK